MINLSFLGTLSEYQKRALIEKRMKKKHFGKILTF